MLDWLIIGAGIHGCVIAHALIAHGRLHDAPNTAPRIRLLDPHGQPLAVWRRLTHSCGMRYLRSPAAHAIVPSFTGLLGWARREGYNLVEQTTQPYARPSLELFGAHADAMISATGLGSLITRGRALRLEPRDGAWVVATDSNELAARRVVLALGRSDGPLVPGWARGHAPRVVHLFDPGFRRDAPLTASSPTIVGGGVSAVHLALHLAARGARVRLLMRHEPRIHQFDSEPCYLGPSCMRDYLAESDPERRRSILDRARHPGSIPPDVHAELQLAIAAETVELVVDEVRDAADSGRAELVLTGDSGSYRSGLVVLATGFAPGPPGLDLIGPLARGTYGGAPLPTDSAGYPIPRASLEWADGLYVTGSLGEQELGPSAPNIIGAHNSAKRIVSHLAGRPRKIPAAWSRYAPASVSTSSDSC
jgi:hypothetical protein